MLRTKRLTPGRAKALDCIPPHSLGCFALSTSTAQTPASRKSYSPERRIAVEAVRKRRACLRCHLLKIPCDMGEPCGRCKKLATEALKLQAKKTLQFSACIRTSLIAISIFEHALPDPDVRELILSKTINSTSIAVPGEEYHNIPSVRAVVTSFISWLNRQHDADFDWPGSLSSPRFLAFIRPLVGNESHACCFQRFLHADSGETTQFPNNNHLTPFELAQVGYLAGHLCLKYFDKKLRAGFIWNCSEEHLMIMFCLIFNAISATCHAKPITVFQPFPPMNPLRDQPSQTLFEAMQDQICRTLGHFAVFIASRLNLHLTPDAERSLLNASPSEYLLLSDTFNG